MKKITYVISSFEMGGAEQLLASVINNAPKNWSLQLIIMKSKTSLLNRIHNKNIEVVVSNSKRYSFLQFIYLAYRVMKFKPDIVHSHMNLANFYARLVLGPITHAKIINHYHGLSMWKNSVWLFFDYISQFLVDRVVVCSSASYKARQSREKIKTDKIVCIKNAHQLTGVLEEREFYNGIVKIGMACRLTEIKNMPAALKIMDKLPSNKVCLKIAGDGPLYHEISKTIKDMSLKNVELLGRVEDIEGFLNGINIFLTTSEFEDFPVSLVEAAACGNYLVANDVGGICDIFTTGMEGYLGDCHSQKFIERLTCLVDDIFYSKIPAYSKKNNQLSALFSTHKYIENLDKIYSES